MAKTLKSILEAPQDSVLTPGSYEPLSKGDKDFEKLHKLKLNDYRGEIKGKTKNPDEAIWTGSNRKIAPRLKASVTESSELTTNSPPIAPRDAWHHMDKFASHARDHIDAKSKAQSAKRNSENEPDPELKAYYKSLSGHYSKAADHHKAMCNHHANHFQLSENVEETGEDLLEISDAALKRYSDKAHASAAKHIKTGIKTRSSAMGQVTNGIKTRESRPSRMKLADKILKKGHNRSSNASKVDNKLRKEEFELSEAAKKKLKSAVKKKYLWKNNKKAMRDANS